MRTKINNSSRGYRQGRFSAWWESQTGRELSLWDKITMGVLLAVFLFVFYVTLDANKYAALVHIAEGEGRVGVNPTTESLDFGDLSRGTSAVRRVDIENNTFLPMYVMALKVGGIAGLMDIDKNFFRLDARDAAKINFTTYVPASAEVDRIYRGRVFLFKVPIL